MSSPISVADESTTANVNNTRQNEIEFIEDSGHNDIVVLSNNHTEDIQKSNNNDSTSKDQYSSSNEINSDKSVSHESESTDKPTYEASPSSSSSSSLSSASTNNNNSESTQNTQETNEPILDRTRKRRLSHSSRSPDVDKPSETETLSPKKLKTRKDSFCWSCHKETDELKCAYCPRSWHHECSRQPFNLASVQNWTCDECLSILTAEASSTKAVTMVHVTDDDLCKALKHVIQKMKDSPYSNEFMSDPTKLPGYLDWIVHPMDLSSLENNIQSNQYGSVTAFIADAKWILHNCIIYNSNQTKWTKQARELLNIAETEVSEIEKCFDCYVRGSSRSITRDWFLEVCRCPHPLVWAKVKGFPYWPAKAFYCTDSQGRIEVRFFAERNHAWLKPKDIYLYSENSPNGLFKRKTVMDEVTEYISKLKVVFGTFQFANRRIQYNPLDPMQIKLLLPEYDPLKKYDPVKFFETRDNQISLDKNISNENDNNLNINHGINKSQKRKYVRKKTKIIEDDANENDDNFTLTVSPQTDDDENNKVKKKTNIKKLKKKTISDKKMFRISKNVKNKLSKNIKNAKMITAVEGFDQIELKINKFDMKTKNQLNGVVPKRKAGRPKGKTKAKQLTNDKIDENPPKEVAPSENLNLDKDGENEDDENPTTLATARKNSLRRTSVASENNTSETGENRSETESRISTLRPRTPQPIRVRSPSPSPSPSPTPPTPPIIEKKQMKAKKSFPNKPPPPPVIPSLPQTSVPIQQHNFGLAIDVSPPRLQRKRMYELLPPEAGPLSAQLYSKSKDLSIQVAQFLEDAIKTAREISGEKLPESINDKGAAEYFFQLQIERLKWEQRQEMAEINKNYEQNLKSIRATLETEKIRLIEELKKETAEDKMQCIKSTKLQQWCSWCYSEATFRCCWNAAYCSTPCQQSHWLNHKSSCKNKENSES